MHTLMCTLKTDCSTSVPDYGSDPDVVITKQNKTKSLWNRKSAAGLGLESMT